MSLSHFNLNRLLRNPTHAFLASGIGILVACGDEPVSSSVQQKPVQVAKNAAPPPDETKPGQLEGTATYRIDNTIGAKQLGIPLYPNAKLLKSGTWDIRDPHDGSEALTSLHLHSSDPLDKVAAFYRQQVENAQIIEINRSSGKRVSVTVSLPDRTTTNAVLREEGSGTRIEITKLGNTNTATKQ